jgi:hypothetical protein
MSLSSASNRLVDEALRMQEYPMIIFRDGPSGRRARLVGGPDVWEVIGSVRSAREAEPDLNAGQIMALVADTTGIEPELLQAALAYWADHTAEVDAFVDRTRTEADQAQQRWQRQDDLLQP